MQKFKGDATELKMIECAKSLFDDLSAEKTTFFEQCYSAGPLGDILWTDERAPLSQTIKQDVFRDAFQAIFEEYRHSGTFESYNAIFDQIFGTQCEVEFTVPAPGKLNIDIVAGGFSIDDIIDDVGDSLITQDGVDHIITKSRSTSSDFAIVSTFIAGVETIYELVDSDGDNILFQFVKGFKTPYELEQMLFEFVPAGIFTTVTLTI